MAAEEEEDGGGRKKGEGEEEDNGRSEGCVAAWWCVCVGGKSHLHDRGVLSGSGRARGRVVLISLHLVGRRRGGRRTFQVPARLRVPTTH